MCDYLQIVQIFIEGIGAFFTLVAVLVGWFALNTWKKEKKSNLADEIINTTIQLKELIEWSRNPAHFDEGKSRPLGNNENERNKLKDSYYVCQERLQNKIDLIQKIRLLKIKSSLHFSKLKIAEELERLLKVVIYIKNSSNWLIRDIENNLKDNKARIEHQNKIYSSLQEGEDEIQKIIDEATTKITNILKVYL